MFTRKQSWPPAKEKYSKTKDTHFILLNSQLSYSVAIFISLSLWLFALFCFFPATSSEAGKNLNSVEIVKPICADPSLSVYVYQLPAEFNSGLLSDCRHLNIYTDMCPHVQNSGLGQPISGLGDDSDGSSNGCWYATHQFIAEMIFHARVENHPCRTLDPNRASLFYVPFYGGLHSSSMFRESNYTVRDALAVRLVDFLEKLPTWQRNNGQDHFLALGRTAWDFMRNEAIPDFGANCLLNLPRVKNMSVLTVERHPWNGANQFGIPYPSYFHPSTSLQMLRWQKKMTQSARPYLFTFIGAPRKGVEKAAIRDELIKQCGESTRCNLVKCGKGASKCHNPIEVLELMSRSQFCLQAPGDSFTRRSTFDSVVAGCIPVFFSPHTAYSQYAWFFPANSKMYSVFIDGDKKNGTSTKNIEKELMKISAKSIKKMRKEIIQLIPRITYAHPNSTDLGFEDAVDVALAALSKQVQLKLRERDL